MALFQIVNFLLFGITGKLGTPPHAINNLIGKNLGQAVIKYYILPQFRDLAKTP
jgi:hypothetical protein